MPQITVIMPVHNGSSFIKQAIESVLNQTFDDFELLIVNDASRDDTLSITAHFTDRRIRTITNRVQLGVTKSLNKAIDLARGRLIARLDADDVAYPDRLRKQRNVLENDSKVGLVTSQTEVINKAGASIGFAKWQFSPEALYYVLHFRNCLSHSSVMFRKNLVIKLHRYAEDAVAIEDFDLWHRLSYVAKIVQIAEPLVQWRDHGGGISQQVSATMLENADTRCQIYVKALTGKQYEASVISALIRPSELNQASTKTVAEVAQAHPKVSVSILEAAPAQYDQSNLRRYVAIEQSKFAFILGQMDVTYRPSLPIDWHNRSLGYLNYLARYRNVYPLRALIPKDHF